MNRKAFAALATAAVVTVAGLMGYAPISDAVGGAPEAPCSCLEVAARVGELEREMSGLRATLDQVDGKVDRLLARALE